MNKDLIIVANGELSHEIIMATLRVISMRVIIVNQVQNELSECVISGELTHKVLRVLDLEQQKYIKKFKEPSDDIALLSQLWNQCLRVTQQDFHKQRM